MSPRLARPIRVVCGISTLVLLLLPACPAAAVPVTVTRIAPFDAAAVDVTPPPAACILGTQGTATHFRYFSSSVMLGYFALILRPGNDCPHCALGFRPTAFHMILRVQEACTSEFQFLTVAGASVGECPVPVNAFSLPDPSCAAGEAGMPSMVDFPEAGVYDVRIEVGCACADIRYNHAFVVVPLGGCGAGYQELGHTAAPTFCTNYLAVSNQTDPEWYGPPLFDPPGDQFFYVEADCCEPPVPAQERSWGAWKERYGD
jgi:hypothetical protein